VGLSMFAAVVAIQAGPQFVQGLREAGVSIFIAGVIVTIVPMLFALLIGKYLFKMHPGILLGACAGARASSVALSVIQDAFIITALPPPVAQLTSAEVLLPETTRTFHHRRHPTALRSRQVIPLQAK